MNLDLHQYNALVMGGSKGIGFATAVELALLGANITLAARGEAQLQLALVQLPKTATQSHDYICLDANDLEDITLKINDLVSKKAIHILINNSGGPAGGPAYSADTSAFLAAFQQHLIANHKVTQLCLEGMKAAKYGRIINIISTSVKQPLDGLGVSNTIRGAVASWAKTLANELAIHGITVNNVLPGATGTERLSQIIGNNAQKKGISIEAASAEMVHEIPMHRFALPQEIAAAAAFLASPAAAYITGINVPVDGGRTKSL
jgi:3-oxoacyl-[acyl-carrier protein] reductase